MSQAASPPPHTAHKLDSFQMAVDYVGIIAFGVAFLVTRQILVATFALVVGAVIGLAMSLMIRRRIAPLPAIYGGAALVFGTLTLVFHDPTIVKMKTTIIDAVLGIVMLGGLVRGKSPIKLLIGDALPLTDRGWRKLTLRFGLFFLILAALNEFIWRTQSTEVWVAFRVPGLVGLTLVFAMAQTPLFMREAALVHAQSHPEPKIEPEES